MQSGPILAAWLDDPVRQAQSRAAAAELAARWKQAPAFAALARKVEASRSVDALERAAIDLFDDKAAIDRLLIDLIEEAGADPFFCPPLQQVSSEINNGYVLFSHPSLIVTLGVIGVDGLAAKRTDGEGPRSLTFTGQRTILEFVRAGGANLSFWEAPAAGPRFAGSAGARCRMTGRRRVRDGERLFIDGRRESFVIEHATGDMVCLQAVVLVDRAPVTVEYDSRTLAFAGASSNDEAASRTQMMASLIRLMDRADAAPLFDELLRSPHFFTRWHVMREYLALDADAALPALRRMAFADPHPEVRAAASETLAHFFPAEIQEEALPCPA